MIPITSKGERARELFLSGYNCAQSTAGAFAEEIGLGLDTVLKLAQPFGGGMGRMREVCGTFSGILFTVGQLFGDAVPGSDNKARVYIIVQELADRFKKEQGSLICRDILGLLGADTDPSRPEARTAEYYKKRPCANTCAIAASILESYLKEKEAASPKP